MRLLLKFVEDAGEVCRSEVAQDADRLGASAFRPMFPTDEDPSLRSVYVLELGEHADAGRVASKLRRHSGVKSVEPELRRYLVA